MANFVKRLVCKTTVALCLLWLFSLGLFLAPGLAFASPPTSAYAPGETLNPTCSPSGTNCTVEQVYVSTTTLNYGIGTTSPYAKLSVNGQLVAASFTSTSTSATSTFTGALFGISGGNVGIGTSTPNNLLQVYDLIDFNNLDKNTKIGYQAGKNLILGTSALSLGAAKNTFVGYQAGLSSSTASTNAADGNTGIGYLSLTANTTGTGNAATGYLSLTANTTGSYNTANGAESLESNTTGANNTAVGLQALIFNTTGSNNTALGFLALQTNTTGSNNTAIGYNGLYDFNVSDATGNNTALGYNTGRGIVTGINNTILGANITGLSSTLSNNIIIADGSGNQRINVDSVGSVGIGTTSPYAKLSVNGQVVAATFVATSTTATSTFSGGTVLALSSGLVGIGTANPVAPLQVGGYNVTNSVGAQILVSRSLDNSNGSGNGHAFSDSSTVSRSGTIGYNSYDARIVIGGGVNYDHYAAFQALPSYNNAGGTMTNYYGLYTGLSLQVTSTTTNTYGTYVSDPTGAGDVLNNYGLYVEYLHKSTTTNYALYTAGTTTNYFGGNLGIGSTSPYVKLSLEGSSALGNSATAGYFIATGTTATSTLMGDMRIGGLVGIGPIFSTTTTNIQSPKSSLDIIGSLGNLARIGYSVTNSGVATTSDNFNASYFHLGGGEYNTNSFRFISFGYHLSTTVNVPATFGFQETLSSGFTKGDFIFETRNSTNDLSPTERMRVTSDGRIGIGSSSPSATLTVDTQQNLLTGPLFSVGYSSVGNGTTTALIINGSTAYVGIATTTPGQMLSVVGNAVITGNMVVESALKTTSVSTTTFNGGLEIETTGFIYDSSTNQVGIGIAPRNLLDVALTNPGGTIGTNVMLDLVDRNGAVSNVTQIGFGYRATSQITPAIIGGIVEVGSGNTKEGLFFATRDVTTDTAPQERVRISASGNVGIGSTSPYAKLSIAGQAVADSFVATSTTATSTFAGGATFAISGGNVGIGTSTPAATLNLVGSLCVDDLTPTCGDSARAAGTVYAVNAFSQSLDLAESYPTKDLTLEPGDVVMNDRRNNFFVSRADSASQLSVLGIVSTNPGFYLGGFNDDLYKQEKKLPIALAGRVPIKVNLEGGPISPGDWLTLSSMPGFAKRATVSGEMVGIAFEPFDGSGSDNKIEAFVKVGYHEIKSQSGMVTSLSGIKEWIVDKITAVTGNFENIFAKQVTTDKLCVGETCVTANEFRALVQNAHIETPPVSVGLTSGNSATSSVDTNAPVITVLGNNPAEIEIGSSYVDLGATVFDDTDHNLGIQVTGDVIDTSISGTFVVSYRSTDQAGNIGTATREVVVKEKLATSDSLISTSTEGVSQ